MRIQIHSWIKFICVLSLLSSCSDPPSKLSKREVFLISGLFDGKSDCAVVSRSDFFALSGTTTETRMKEVFHDYSLREISGSVPFHFPKSPLFERGRISEGGVLATNGLWFPGGGLMSAEHVVFDRDSSSVFYVRRNDLRDED